MGSRKRSLTIQAVDETIDYGQTPALAYTITSGNLVNGDRVSGVLAVNNTEVGVHVITQGSLTAGNNYQITFIEGILTVLSVSTAIDITVDGQKPAGMNPYRFATEKPIVDVVVKAANAEVSISGQSKVPEGIPVPVALHYGENIVTITVTAQNGATQQYILIIERYYDRVIYEFADVPTVNCNTQTNGGYTFTDF